MMVDKRKKYLCAAPRPSTWEEKAEALLKSLGGDPKKRETVLRQTLSALKERHTFSQDVRRTGPGRRSHAEHAVGFYEYVLDLNKEDDDDDDSEGHEFEEDGGSTSGHDGDEDDEKRETSKRRKKKKSKTVRGRKKKSGEKGDGSGKKKRGSAETSSSESDSSDGDSGDESSCGSSNEGGGEHQEEKTVESMDSAEFLNEHNDQCEVCNVGGELLCCSTCNLVFHMDCVRPTLAELPPGDWSCAHCIVSGVRGYKRHSREFKAAAAGVRHMDRLNSRLKKKRLDRGKELEEDVDDDEIEVEEEDPPKMAKLDGNIDAADPPRTPAGRKKQGVPDCSTTDANDKNKDLDKTPTAENKLEDKKKAEGIEDRGNSKGDNVSKNEESRAATNTVEANQNDRIGTAESNGEESQPEKDKEEAAHSSPMVAAKIEQGNTDMNTDEIAEDDKVAGDDDRKSSQLKRGPAKRSLALFKIADSLSSSMKLESGDNESRVRRPRRQPTLFNPQNCPDSEWQSDERLEWLTNSTRASSSEDEKSGGEDLKREAIKVEKDENKTSKPDDKDGSSLDKSNVAEELKDETPTKTKQASMNSGSGFVWCSFCKDDPSIAICCFCACRICFGKHDKANLLLCDRCDGEYHTFCLKPPLKSVPTTKRWYCPKCKPLIAEELAAAKALSKAGTTRASVKKTPRVSRKISPEKKISRSKSPSSCSMKSSKSGSGRPRGRPPKAKSPVSAASPEIPGVPRKRGRPPKTSPSSPGSLSVEPRKRGRPPKNATLGVSQTTTKKQRVKSPPSTASSNSEKRKGGSGSVSPKGDNKRSRTDPGTSQGSKSEIAGGKESVSEIKHSRSGRMLKRSSFHDEIDEGEQHLRVTQPDQPRKQKKQQKQVEKPQRSKSETSQKSNSIASPVVEVAIKDHDDEEEKLDVESLESVGPARPFRAIGAKNTQPRPPTTLPVVPAESVAMPDEASVGSQVTYGAKPRTASPTPPAETKVPPDVEGSNPTVNLLVDPVAGSDDGDTTRTNSPSTKVVEEPPVAPISTSMAAEPPATTPSESTPTPDVATAGGQSKDAGAAKVPRRKPGARECMQISRRFGVRVIPDKYMNTLMDYCTRGKVEHLIRMRERLDEHSRYLEAQLAGLEALVEEKGEIDVVVPKLPERTQEPKPQASQGKGSN